MTFEGFGRKNVAKKEQLADRITELRTEVEKGDGHSTAEDRRELNELYAELQPLLSSDMSVDDYLDSLAEDSAANDDEDGKTDMPLRSAA